MKNHNLTLTPNRRLQEYWQQQLHQSALLSHKACAATPILSWSMWVNALWQAAAEVSAKPLPRLLNGAQSRWLWEHLVQESAESSRLLNINATAKCAAAAWELHHAWDLDFAAVEYQDNEDTQWFWHLAQKFRDYCQQHDWIDPQRARLKLRKHLASIRQELPKTITCLGFAEWTPSQQQLRAQLSELGCEFIDKPRPNQHSLTQRVALNNAMDEVSAMARWAKQLWQQGKTNIACVVPDLAQQRAEVAAIFYEEFADGEQIPLNITGGTPLATQPMMITAFTLCRFSMGFAETNDVSQVIRSPFIAGGETESLARAQLDVAVRASKQRHFSPASLLRLLADFSCPLLQASCEKAAIATSVTTPRHWAERFAECLANWGWPGERECDSVEYQCVQRWHAALDEFASLSAIVPDMDGQTALNHCYRICSNTMFQAQSQQQPIQVLGLLEAAQHPFEYGWIMGLTDDNWPPAAKPNPLIPLSLQRRHEIAHSSAERELHFCQNLMRDFQAYIKQLIVSYPQTDGDNPLLMSRLLQSIPEVEISALALAPSHQRLWQCQQSNDLEAFQDNQAPAVDAQESIQGGSFLLKSMANCPFQAFAHFRLHTRALEQTQLGLDGAERGLLLHRALEYFWRQVHSHQQLTQLSETDSQQLCQAAVAHALKPLLRRQGISALFLQCETARLLDIIQRYLQLEITRPPFSVQAVEHQHKVNLAGLELTLRSDRIDRCQQGHSIVIDYKTAVINLSSWFGERPDEPQLPLYAISEAEIHGLLIMQLKSDALRFNGVSADQLSINGVTPIAELSRIEHADDWEQQVALWRETLTLLAERFMQGDASVAPKTAASCKYCDLSGFCRV